MLTFEMPDNTEPPYRVVRTRTLRQIKSGRYTTFDEAKQRMLGEVDRTGIEHQIRDGQNNTVLCCEYAYQLGWLIEVDDRLVLPKPEETTP
jgi:L-asparaginase/Glu-tRNA(Gln) amidotransferase subunit D